MMTSYVANDYELRSKIMVCSFVWVRPSIITNKQTNKQTNKLSFRNYFNPESAQTPFSTKMTLMPMFETLQDTMGARIQLLPSI